MAAARSSSSSKSVEDAFLVGLIQVVKDLGLRIVRFIAQFFLKREQHPHLLRVS